MGNCRQLPIMLQRKKGVVIWAVHHDHLSWNWHIYIACFTFPMVPQLRTQWQGWVEGLRNLLRCNWKTFYLLWKSHYYHFFSSSVSVLVKDQYNQSTRKPLDKRWRSNVTPKGHCTHSIPRSYVTPALRRAITSSENPVHFRDLWLLQLLAPGLEFSRHCRAARSELSGDPSPSAFYVN